MDLSSLDVELLVARIACDRPVKSLLLIIGENQMAQTADQTAVRFLFSN